MFQTNRFGEAFAMTPVCPLSQGACVVGVAGNWWRGFNHNL